MRLLCPCLLAVCVSACGGSRDPGSSQPSQTAAGTVAQPVAGVSGTAGSGRAAAAGSGGAGAAGTGTPGAAGSRSSAAGASGAAGARTAPDLDDAGVPNAGTGAHAGAPADAGPPPALDGYAKDLNALFLDAPCDAATQTPLAQMATCLHPNGMMRVMKQVTFGGMAGTVYNVKLRVRGIWEPTKIQGGERPYGSKVPFTVGGMVPPGTGSSDPVSYQQYSIKVSQPAQTYWLNDYGYVAHDIHKEDYQVELSVGGGSMVTVTMNDGNEREIANWTKDFFEGVPPYDTKPSLGQSLRLDVMAVTEKK